jgi:hypothetical protein
MILILKSSQSFRKDRNQKRRDLGKVFQIHQTKSLIRWHLRLTVGKIADKVDIPQLREILNYKQQEIQLRVFFLIQSKQI